MLAGNENLLSQSVTTQTASISLLGCRWEWCRCTFLDQAELVNHVIHEHVRTAVPIRRRDIPAARRMEGEVLKGQSQVTPSFASLSSPSPAQTHSGISSIPPSPSFNTLVSRTVKKNMPRHSALTYGPELSQSTTSSFASQASVAMKLTQTTSLDEEDSEGEVSQRDSEASDSSSSDNSTSGSDSEVESSESRHHFLLHRHSSKKMIYPSDSHQVDSTQTTSSMSKCIIPTTPSKYTRKSRVDRAQATEGESPFFTGSMQPQAVADVEMRRTSPKRRSLSKEKADLRFNPTKIPHIPLNPERQLAEQTDSLVNAQAISLSQNLDDPLETQHMLDFDIHSMSFGEHSYPPLQTQAPYDSQK